MNTTSETLETKHNWLKCSELIPSTSFSKELVLLGEEQVEALELFCPPEAIFLSPSEQDARQNENKARRVLWDFQRANEIL